MIRVEVRPEAAADVEKAALWYEDRRMGLGSEFLAELSATKLAISEAPLTYRLLERDVRRAKLNRFPYGLYFRILEDRILVVACMHARQSPRRWRSRK